MSVCVSVCVSLSVSACTAQFLTEILVCRTATLYLLINLKHFQENVQIYVIFFISELICLRTVTLF